MNNTHPLDALIWDTEKWLCGFRNLLDDIDREFVEEQRQQMEQDDPQPYDFFNQ